MAKEWMSLSEIASELGVHPSTIRHWADQGRIPVHRTQGGHRRFKRGEIELWRQSQRISDGTREANLVVQSALGRTRFRISEGQLEAESWYQKLDQVARTRYRNSGRALLQGLTAYLVAEGSQADAEARATGYEYGTIGHRYGLSQVETVRAYLFFRNTLFDAMLDVYESAGVNSPVAWSEMLRKINSFTDLVMLALMETHEAFGQGVKNEK